MESKFMGLKLDNTIEFLKNSSFLVRLPKELNIPEWHILSTNRPVYKTTLQIDIAEVYDINDKTINSLKNIDEYKMLHKKNDSVIIDVLDKTGVILYSMIYKNIDLQYELNDLSYLNESDNNYAIIKLKIDYDMVELVFK